MKCIAITLKGKRCGNPRRWTPDPYHEPVTCRIHQHLEPPETYALAQKRYKADVENEKAQRAKDRESYRIARGLPPLTMSVRAVS